ncbi:MAG: hypothetical protein GTN77_10775, partial [Planctomycetales bacterium]|nr:hypothetical protein [Planctomycetales bacterium]
QAGVLGAIALAQKTRGMFNG